MTVCMTVQDFIDFFESTGQGAVCYVGNWKAYEEFLAYSERKLLEAQGEHEQS